MSNIFFKKNTVIELIGRGGGGNCVPMYSNKCSEIGKMKTEKKLKLTGTDKSRCHKL
jgi:hypothetical protein